MGKTATIQPTLPTFESNPVQTSTVRITKAGDGLSAALEVQPKALQLNEEVTYVIRSHVSQVNHRMDDDGQVTRQHTLVVDGITEIDPEIAEKLLVEAAEELERKRAELAGQERMEDEGAAQERERRDDTDSPTDIAEAAARRAKASR